MTDGPELRVLEYSQAAPRSNALRRRVLYCVGMPLVAFGLCQGFRYELNGMIGAAGALLVALAVPVRD